VETKMKVSVIEKGEISRTLQIEVPSEIVAAEYEKTYSKVAAGANVPGFRKGNLKLEVTPQITPEGSVIMRLDVTKDSVGQSTPAGFAIDMHIPKGMMLVIGRWSMMFASGT
jgi:hypothetical protein